MLCKRHVRSIGSRIPTHGEKTDQNSISSARVLNGAGSPQGTRDCLWEVVSSKYADCLEMPEAKHTGGPSLVLTVFSASVGLASRGQGREWERKELENWSVGLAEMLAVIGHKIYIL